MYLDSTGFFEINMRKKITLKRPTYLMIGEHFFSGQL